MSWPTDRRARLSQVAVALALALATLFAFAPLAQASVSAKPKRPASKVTLNTPVIRGSRYLALGDSVTFGYQEATVVPAPNYHDATNFLGYPEHLGRQLHLKITNASCPGETSGSLINVSTLSNGCENGYRTLYPLHVSYKGAQLAFAQSFLRQHRDTKLVSLMIGANDLFLCQRLKNGCTNPADLKATLSAVGRNVRTILSAVRNKAHYAGQLAIVNYYSLDYAVPAVSTVVQSLNKTVDAAAKPFHVVIADGFGELKQATFRFAGDPCAAGLITQLGTPGKCGVHPTYAGSALLAAALGKVISL
jgi:lysophospholipase L1-like esterase